MTDLAVNTVRLEVETSKWTAGTDKAAKDLSALRDEVGDLLKDIAGKFAAAFTVDAITEFVQGAVESAAALNRLSQESGVAVEQLSAFAAVAAQSGAGQDVMAESLKKLNQAVSEAAGNPTSKAAFAFQALGISVTNANGSLKTAGQLLPGIADAYAKLADGPNKVAINTDLLGRSSLALIPVLNQGADALDALQRSALDAGSAMTGELAEAAENLEKKFIALKQGFVGTISTEVLEAAIPVLDKFADGILAVSNSADSSKGALALFTGALKVVGAIIIEADKELKEIESTFDGVKDFAVRAAQGIEDAFNALGSSGILSALDVLSDASKQAMRILDKQEDDAKDIYEAGNQAINGVVQAGGKVTVSLYKEIAQGIKDTLGDAFKDQDFGQGAGVSPALLQQLDLGKKKIQDFADSIKVQAQSFGLGSAAAIDFKLTTGDMADVLALAKKQLDATADSSNAGAVILHAQAKATLDAANAARQYAAALQGKQDTREIQDYTDKLHEQVLKLGQSDVAAIDFAASTGKLGEALTRVGTQGDIARAHIHDLAVELTNDKDKTALFSIDQQIQTLTGNLAVAADSAFKFQNALLVKNLSATGDTAGKQQLDDLHSLVIAQSSFNELLTQAQRIRQDEARQESAINDAVTAGQKTTIDGENAISAARTAEAAQLDVLYQKLQLIPDAAKIPQLVEETKDFAAAIKNLQTSAIDPLALKLRSDFIEAGSDAFAAFVTGSETASQAIKSFLTSVETELVKLATNKLLEQLFNSTSSGAGSIFGALAGLLGGGGGASTDVSSGYSLANAGLAAFNAGGGLASGGPAKAGSRYIIGEHHAEEFVPDVDGHVISNPSVGDQTVNQYFSISAPTGTVSRQTQQQIAAQAGSGINRATRRNN